MLFSNYIHRQNSILKNGYKILFNTKNAHSLIYNTKVYPLEKDLIENEEIADYMFDNGFLVANHEVEKNTLFSEFLNYSQRGETLAITIFVHGNCNFRCTYCYENFVEKHLSLEKQDTIFSFIENKIETENIENLTISWFGGEPLLGIKTIERLSTKLIDLTKSKNIFYTSSITTNGYLLNERVFNKLLNLKVSSFQITVNGHESIHNIQRKHISGSGTYDRIIDNIKNTRKSNADFEMTIRVNVSNENYLTMDLFFEDMIEHFKNDERFKVNFHSVMDFCDNFVETITKDVTLELTKNYLLKGGNTHPVLGLLMPQSICYAAKKNNYAFGINGEIFKCTVALNENQNQIGVYSEGKILLDSSKENEWLCTSDEEKCNNCILLPVCWGNNCPWHRIKFGSARCLHFKNNLNEVIEILELQNLIEAEIG